jgi:hypothetical protein
VLEARHPVGLPSSLQTLNQQPTTTTNLVSLRTLPARVTTRKDQAQGAATCMSHPFPRVGLVGSPDHSRRSHAREAHRLIARLLGSALHMTMLEEG